MENLDNNTLVVEQEHHEFNYDFINIPWDSRSRKSKIGIVVLLVSIFVATMSVVIHNLTIHYSSHNHTTQKLDLKELENCQFVKVEDYRYVARIHSMVSQELVCVGAVIAESSVLAHSACVQNGQVLIYVGNPDDLRCAIGFTTFSVEQVGQLTELVILTTVNRMTNCVRSIQVGSYLRKSVLAFVIGKPSRNEKLLSRHAVTVASAEKCSCQRQTRRNSVNNSFGLLCVRRLVQCPMKVGDLLVQSDKLYGLSDSSTYGMKQYKDGCFVDLSLIEKNLLEQEL